MGELVGRVGAVTRSGETVQDTGKLRDRGKLLGDDWGTWQSKLAIARERVVWSDEHRNVMEDALQAAEDLVDGTGAWILKAYENCVFKEYEQLDGFLKLTVNGPGGVEFATKMQRAMSSNVLGKTAHQHGLNQLPPQE